jgi:hypothetical protein
VRVTLNDIVRVKLTDYGRKVMRENHEDLKASAYHAPEEDENGYSKWQLWCLMEEFGAHMRWGGELPFELEIDLPKPEPKAERPPYIFLAENHSAITAIRDALAYADVHKVVRLHFNDWETIVRQGDSEQAHFDDYCKRHVTPRGEVIESDSLAVPHVWEADKGVSICEAIQGALGVAKKRKSRVLLKFNDWQRLVGQFDDLSALLHEWQKFQKETRHG